MRDDDDDDEDSGGDFWADLGSLIDYAQERTNAPDEAPEVIDTVGEPVEASEPRFLPPAIAGRPASSERLLWAARALVRATTEREYRAAYSELVAAVKAHDL